MTDREKVIKGLVRCIEKQDTVINRNHGFNCNACPYIRRCESIGYLIGLPLMRDALALLKAQEPRVATWEEAQANVQDGPFIIFEVRDSTGSEVDFGVLAGDFYEMSEGSVLTVADFWMMKDDYGKRFRLWTSRPTDEQREAVKWNG